MIPWGFSTLFLCSRIMIPVGFCLFAVGLSYLWAFPFFKGSRIWSASGCSYLNIDSRICVQYSSSYFCIGSWIWIKWGVFDYWTKFIEESMKIQTYCAEHQQNAGHPLKSYCHPKSYWELGSQDTPLFARLMLILTYSYSHTHTHIIILTY